MNEPTLSVVVPAYNEARRLPRFLESLRQYFHGRSDYEILVVDDGSRDEQCSLVEAKQADWPQLKLIRHEINRGKGAAVRTGMLAARGAMRLFADADGATPIDQERLLRAALDSDADVACGSRLVSSDTAEQNRWFFRSLAGKTYATIARMLVPVPVRDTQCGFKMFTSAAAERLFMVAEESGFAFDVELLALAGEFGMRVDEIPVQWQEQAGGKVSMLRDGGKMLRQLWKIRRRMRRRRLTASGARHDQG
jgi:dolichyl-phosphate beta-glucosyltransferase